MLAAPAKAFNPPGAEGTVNPVTGDEGFVKDGPFDASTL
jgi:hypothetical protein